MLVILSALSYRLFSFFFFFNDTATTEIYTLSLHDALPISIRPRSSSPSRPRPSRRAGSWPPRSTRSSAPPPPRRSSRWARDRKSTRLNSSHLVISYAVFCLKKNKQLYTTRPYHCSLPQPTD